MLLANLQPPKVKGSVIVRRLSLCALLRPCHPFPFLYFVSAFPLLLGYFFFLGIFVANLPGTLEALQTYKVLVLLQLRGSGRTRAPRVRSGCTSPSQKICWNLRFGDQLYIVKHGSSVSYLYHMYGKWCGNLSVRTLTAAVNVYLCFVDHSQDNTWGYLKACT